MYYAKRIIKYGDHLHDGAAVETVSSQSVDNAERNGAEHGRFATDNPEVGGRKRDQRHAINGTYIDEIPGNH